VRRGVTVTVPPPPGVCREWCRGQMLALRRDPDLTLVEFLMGVPSAGETLEYIDMYLKEDVKQKAVRDAFANEFLKCASPGLCHGPVTPRPSKGAASRRVSDRSVAMQQPAGASLLVTLRVCDLSVGVGVVTLDSIKRRRKLEEQAPKRRKKGGSSASAPPQPAAALAAAPAPEAWAKVRAGPTPLPASCCVGAPDALAASGAAREHLRASVEPALQRQVPSAVRWRLRHSRTVASLSTTCALRRCPSPRRRSRRASR
jgi:hypothetical protein